MSENGALVLVRHGESTANASGTFTGVIDVDLSALGVRQAHRAAQLLTRDAFMPDAVFTSPLTRARHTTDLIADDLPLAEAEHHCCWRLSERDYGCLSGMARYLDAGSARTAGEQIAREGGT